jgi:glycerophosphoryl diester phosphodiesterase
VIIIGHRGAAGYRPEHTLASYALGARIGADHIEPDLVSTKDHVLVARNGNELSASTDVAERPRFADRRTTKVVDGRELTGWFTEDFTLVELRELRARETMPSVRPRTTIYDGRFVVPTFEEVLELARRLTAELGRPVGVYPETKHPTYFRSLGLPLEEPLVEALRRHGLDGRDATVFLQSFEARNLEALRDQVDTPIIQLIGSPGNRPFDDERTWDELATADGLRAIAAYADGVGPSKEWIVPRDAAGRSLEPTSFVDDAHAAGLLVHPFTFRNENRFLPAELRRGDEPDGWGDAIAEYEQFLALGVDGVFSDHADTALEARDGAPG